ncbi:hypothetical protein HJG60_011977 [Phyllostomus discolor]|uniref:Uncharacterized protein n=1 Tax=Phyllostomus discolor TaxID=89673 RepID=A0A834DW47_9CHIR|nr:hypothetical protein HJG60_011977 [Phyllostomus discolor]
MGMHVHHKPRQACKHTKSFSGGGRESCPRLQGAPRHLEGSARTCLSQETGFWVWPQTTAHLLWAPQASKFPSSSIISEWNSDSLYLLFQGPQDICCQQARVWNARGIAPGDARSHRAHRSCLRLQLPFCLSPFALTESPAGLGGRKPGRDEIGKAVSVAPRL